MENVASWVVFGPKQDDGGQAQLSKPFASHAEALAKAQDALYAFDFSEVVIFAHDQEGKVIGEYLVAEVAA